MRVEAREGVVSEEAGGGHDEMCVDRWLGMCIDMCVETCVWRRVYRHVCGDMCVETCA